jgi:endonuclease/exonuclease/phosphatase family metal-dependent hydrolase
MKNFEQAAIGLPRQPGRRSMRRISRAVIFRSRRPLSAVVGLMLLLLAVAVRAEVITVMTANLNSGTPPYSDWYRDSAKRIFQGLQPDIVLIQEFNVPSSTTRSQFISEALGAGYYYYVEPAVGGSWAMPNGVISRWPLKSQGVWSDSYNSNRNFAWAVIDVPGPIDLQVVSLHLKAGDGPDERDTRYNEANQLKNYVQANFDNGQYIIVAGDLNLQWEYGESSLNVFKSYLNADSHRPADHTGDRNTNATGPPRTRAYDWIMPNSLLNRFHATLDIGPQAYPEGIVFDSEVFSPLSLVSPITWSDSRDYSCTHMAVMKVYDIPIVPPPPTPPPTPPPVPTPPEFVDIGNYASGDYDGNGTSDIAYFRPGSGLWAVRGVTGVYFGAVGDRPVPGDYDGDGTTDIGLFRAGYGLWAIRGLSRFYYGSSSYIHVPGDYNGDGTCDPAVFRSWGGLWAIRGLTRLYFGSEGDRPVPGDYTGDGTTNIACFRESNGLWVVKDISRIYFGQDVDRTVPGDYNGDGTWEVAVFRPPTGLWAVRSVTRRYFGRLDDRPVPADYAGDSTDRIGVFRDLPGLWAVRGLTRLYYGDEGDVPVTR